MANDKKFIAKNGFLTSDADSSFTNSTSATPTVTFTNSGGAGASSLPGSGAVIAKFAGNSDAMVITNVSDGDYFFGNNQQNNGINFYDGSGGMEFFYNGVEKFSIDSNGTTFATGHTTTGTTITDRLKVEDNGSTSPLVVIKGDDASPWALAIGNDTYSTTETMGHLFYQADAGDAYYQIRGNGVYENWNFQQHNGSTSRTQMRIASTGHIELASNHYVLWGVGDTNRPGFLGDNTNKVLQFHNNGAERMRLDGSGNVGIGTQTATSGRVHVHGGNVRITNTSDVGLKLRHTTATFDFNILQNSNGDLELNYGTTDFVRIKSSGNVGIGSNANNPQYKLDVDGTSRVTGGLTISPGSSGHTSFELGSRSADPLPAATGSYDFKPGMRVGSYELGDINAAANIALAWATNDVSTSSPGYLAASQTYATASWSQSFTVTQVAGTRWFVKVKLNDAESGNDPRLAVNGGTEYQLEYLDAVNASGEAVNDSDTWHVVDVTDDIVTGNNTLKVWLGAGQKTYILAAYVFASTGIALPNEPAESTFYAHDGFGVRDRVIIDKNRDMTNINSVRFETPSTSGGNKNYFANVGTGGQDYWIMSTSNANGSLGGGKFVIGTDAVSGNNADQTRLLIDSIGNVGIGNASTNPGNPLHINHNGAPGGIVAKIQSNGNPWFQQTGASSSWQIGATSNGWELYNDNTTDYRVTVQNDGDVGIGTREPSDKLEVSRTSTDQTVGLTLTNLQAGGYGSGIVWKSKRSDAPNNILDAAKIVVAGENSWNSDGNTASQMQFWTQKDNTLTKHMTLNKNGNLGIGSASPSSKLHIYDSTSTSGSATGSTLLTLDNYVGSDLSQQKTFIDFRMFDDNTNETPQVRIGAEVGANGDANTQILEGEGAFVVYTNDTGGTSGTATGLAERFRVDSPGNVGIGTTSPGAKLHVNKTLPTGTLHYDGYSTVIVTDTESRLQLMSTDGGTNASTLLLSNGIKHWGLHHHGPTGSNVFSIGYRTSAATGEDITNNLSDVFNITTGGDVGIGTATPGNRLHVYESGMVGPDPVVKVNAFYQTDTSYNGHGSIMQLTTNRGDGFSDGYLLDVQNASGTAMKIRGDRKTIFNPGNTDYQGDQTGVVYKTLQIHDEYDAAGTHWTAYANLDGNWQDGAAGADSQHGWIFGHSNNVRGGLIYDHRGIERMALWSSYGKIDFLIADAADGNGVPIDSNINEAMTIIPGGNIGIGTTAPVSNLDIRDTGTYNILQMAGSAGNYTGIKLARGDGTWSSVSNNQFGLLVTDYGMEVTKLTALGNSTTGRLAAPYMQFETDTADNVGIGTTAFDAVVEKTSLSTNATSKFLINYTPLLGDKFNQITNSSIWGAVEPKPIRPSRIRSTAGTNVGSTYINSFGSISSSVVGEADLSAIDADATFTFAAAWAALETHGARMPTLSEIMAGVGQGSGQGYDDDYLWTQTFAGPHHVWVCQGAYNSSASYGAKIVDITDPLEVYRTRGFFDASHKNMSVHYDNNESITTNELMARGDVTAYYSDERLKDFQGTIPDALAKVNRINGYLFTENQLAKELGYTNDRVQAGVSAQEVEAVLPEVVKEAPINEDKGTDYKTVQYDRLVPLLIEAVKELSAKVDSQQEEIDRLKGL